MKKIFLLSAILCAANLVHSDADKSGQQIECLYGFNEKEGKYMGVDQNQLVLEWLSYLNHKSPVTNAEGVGKDDSSSSTGSSSTRTLPEGQKSKINSRRSSQTDGENGPVSGDNVNTGEALGEGKLDQLISDEDKAKQLIARNIQVLSDAKIDVQDLSLVGLDLDPQSLGTDEEIKEKRLAALETGKVGIVHGKDGISELVVNHQGKLLSFATVNASKEVNPIEQYNLGEVLDKLKTKGSLLVSKEDLDLLKNVLISADTNAKKKAKTKKAEAKKLFNNLFTEIAFNDKHDILILNNNYNPEAAQSLGKSLHQIAEQKRFKDQPLPSVHIYNAIDLKNFEDGGNKPFEGLADDDIIVRRIRRDGTVVNDFFWWNKEKAMWQLKAEEGKYDEDFNARRTKAALKEGKVFSVDELDAWLRDEEMFAGNTYATSHTTRLTRSEFDADGKTDADHSFLVRVGYREGENFKEKFKVIDANGEKIPATLNLINPNIKNKHMPSAFHWEHQKQKPALADKDRMLEAVEAFRNNAATKEQEELVNTIKVANAEFFLVKLAKQKEEKKEEDKSAVVLAEGEQPKNGEPNEAPAQENQGSGNDGENAISALGQIVVVDEKNKKKGDSEDEFPVPPPSIPTINPSGKSPALVDLNKEDSDSDKSSNNQLPKAQTSQVAGKQPGAKPDAKPDAKPAGKKPGKKAKK